MFLAIEYLLRHSWMEPPFSLLLNEWFTEERLVISFSKYFANKTAVKHWHLGQYDPACRLPPFKEFIINKEDLFRSPHTIIPGYDLLPFAETNCSGFATGIDYEHCVKNFYHPFAHRNRRENWLWRAFATFHPLPLPSDDPETQREFLHHYSGRKWNLWLHWKHCLLPDCSIAPELIFRAHYELPRP